MTPIDTFRGFSAVAMQRQTLTERLDAVKRLSVVIANYNYARFVGASVESALNVDWDDVEVVVVDDGSTDDSLAVLQKYRSEIKLIATENRGQRSAVNAGFEASTGDGVIFLDSDDVLPPGIARAGSAALRAGVSKVQFQMQRIDEHGAPIGDPFPQYVPVPTPDKIRTWLLATTAYPTAPGSGNLYARSYLEQLMPIGPEVGSFADSALLAAAPLLGDVVTVPGVPIGYRRHGNNDSELGRSDTDFIRECERAASRWSYARRVASLPDDPKRVFRSREVLQFRVAAALCTPRQKLPADGTAQLVSDIVLSPFRPGPEGMIKRLAIAGWCLLSVALPKAMGLRVLRLRFRALSPDGRHTRLIGA